MFLKLNEVVKPPRVLSRPHVGKVVDNLDPKKLGRVKCEIKGIYEGDKANFPWITPKTKFSWNFDVPEINDSLVIEFPFDDVHFPFYVGDWHTEANHDETFDADYPDTFGFHRQGFKFTYNKKTKEFLLEHPSGSKKAIDGDGNFIFTITKDLSFVVDGAINQTAKCDISLSSDANVKIVGKGGVEVTSDGSGKFAGKGGTDVGDSSSVTNVNGSQVMLAGGGNPIAVLGSQAVGTGNMGAPVLSQIVDGSSKVFAPK